MVVLENGIFSTVSIKRDWNDEEVFERREMCGSRRARVCAKDRFAEVRKA
jgi:hypothetical protein